MRVVAALAVIEHFDVPLPVSNPRLLDMFADRNRKSSGQTLGQMACALLPPPSSLLPLQHPHAKRASFTFLSPIRNATYFVLSSPSALRSACYRG